MVHSLEVIHKLNRESVEKSNRKYGGGPPLPTAQLPIVPLPKPAPPQQISMDYPVGLLRMWRFCGYPSSRFPLECVRVDFENGLIEATDGRIAVRHSFEVPEEFKACGEVLLLAEYLRNVYETCNKRRGMYPLKLVKEGDDWFAANLDTRFYLHQGSGRFPNLPAVFKHVPSQSVTLHLNTLLLSKFMTAFKHIENSEGEPCTEVTTPLDGTATWLRIKEKPDGVMIDARLMPMLGDERKPSVRLNRELIWRKATPEDVGRVGRFRDLTENSFAYGLLVEAEYNAFKCKFSDNNEIVKEFELCEVQQ